MGILSLKSINALDILSNNIARLILPRKSYSGTCKIVFRPANWTQKSRVQLVYARMMTADVLRFVDNFNVAYNQCTDILEEKAQLFFHIGLWAEVWMQVLVQQPKSLQHQQK